MAATCSKTSIAASLPQRRPDPVQIELNGQAAYAYTGGKPFDAALPCVVFIHGAQNDHSVWGLQSRWFAHHGFGVLAVDLPGHGRSAGKPLPSIEDLADWIELLLEKVGAGDTAKNVSLVGSVRCV